MFTFFELLHCPDNVPNVPNVPNFYCQEQYILQNLNAIYKVKKHISGKKNALGIIREDLISIKNKLYISIDSLNSAEKLVKNYEPGAIYFDNFSELRKYLNKALDSNNILIKKVDELQKSTI